MQYQYAKPLAEMEYDPEAEIACLLEECQESILQAIKRSTRREQFAPFLGVLMAVKEAQDTARRR